jgi:hypothetical protein
MDSESSVSDFEMSRSTWISASSFVISSSRTMRCERNVFQHSGNDIVFCLPCGREAVDENGAAMLLRSWRGARHDAVDSTGLLAAMLSCLDAIRGAVRGTVP